MASSSTSPLKKLEKQYDVFVNFRGEDVRDVFLSHLHKALSQNEIVAFVDEKLDRGEDISSSLLAIIDKSYISVVIFSENYAYSPWCLDELVKILECNKTMEQMVLPVFYRVDPSHVQNLTGKFGDAIAKHREEPDYLHKVDSWCQALREISEMSGLVSQNIKSDSKLIEEIVGYTLKKLNIVYPNDAYDDGLVGIDSRVKIVESLLCLGSPDVRVIGIWGMGGIGKTTIARQVFDRISAHFTSRCFVANVKERLEKCTLCDVEKEILSDLLEAENSRYFELSNMAIDHAQGIPLALKVLGSNLYGKSEEVWVDELEQLKGVFDEKIKHILRISYDGLRENEKEIFLAIACMFKGEDKHRVESLLDVPGSKFGISRLVDRSLITITMNELHMHDLLQQMGKDIVREEKQFGKRGWLWDPKDIYYLFTRAEGTEAIKGISLDMSTAKELNLKPTAFEKMYNLKFLMFYASHSKIKLYLPKGLNFLPEELRLLHWYRFPLKSLPLGSYVENLVELRMQESKLKELCSGVQRLPENIGNLESLGGLDAANSGLIELPDSICNLRKLETLQVGNCANLHSLPEKLGDLESLTELGLEGTRIKGLPSSVNLLRQLRYIRLESCGLSEFPSCLCRSDSSLEWLLIGGNNFESIPDCIKQLSKLRYLSFRQCYIKITAIFLVQSIFYPGNELPQRMMYQNNCGYSLTWSSSSKQQERVQFGLCVVIDPKFLDPVWHGVSSIGYTVYIFTNETVKELGYFQVKEIIPRRYEFFCPLSSNDLVLHSEHVVFWSERIELPLDNKKTVFEFYAKDRKNRRNYNAIVKCGVHPHLSFSNVVGEEDEVEDEAKRKMKSNCKNLQRVPQLPSGLELVNMPSCSSLESLPMLFTEGDKGYGDFIGLFNFANCFNLVPNACNKIEFDDEEHPSDCEDLCEVRLCKPGTEVPNWFTYQSTGSSLSLSLEAGYSPKMLGCAFSAVVSCQGNNTPLSDLQCDCRFITEYGDSPDVFTAKSKYQLRQYFSNKDGITLQSEHVVFWYESNVFMSKYHLRQASFKFYAIDNDGSRMPDFHIIKCGVHPLTADNDGRWYIKENDREQ
ncbi:hypothetical protein JCGZ_06973 [Jatropha curcas]|uniref:ADP-ribosyl cyclase/cyclic ADP-ribose hydrolase n=1 Tax=Jatropha curcas TaxID=180498 RepID=A0A067KZF0_JATCU|nr:hypothetical protein JCGZ_06973 [Jatropha curcas]